MKFGINLILRVCAIQIYGLLLVLALRSKTASVIVSLGSLYTSKWVCYNNNTVVLPSNIYVRWASTVNLLWHSTATIFAEESSPSTTNIVCCDQWTQLNDIILFAPLLGCFFVIIDTNINCYRDVIWAVICLSDRFIFCLILT